MTDPRRRIIDAALARREPRRACQRQEACRLYSSVVRRRLSARAVLLDVLWFPVVDLDDLLAVVALELRT
jgi:hypothetical protein